MVQVKSKFYDWLAHAELVYCSNRIKAHSFRKAALKSNILALYLVIDCQSACSLKHVYWSSMPFYNSITIYGQKITNSRLWNLEQTTNNYMGPDSKCCLSISHYWCCLTRWISLAICLIVFHSLHLPNTLVEDWECTNMRKIMRVIDRVNA